MNSINNAEQTASQSPPKRLFSVDEAAEALGCGRTYIYSLLKQNKLSGIKLGKLTKITDTSIQKFIDSSPNFNQQ